MNVGNRAVGEQAAGTTETRTGLDPWKRAELPVPPMPKGLGWMSVVGPGVIVLGARDRQRRVPARARGIREARPDATVGRRSRGLLPDHLQYRGDALRPRDRRAGVHRLHAHAAVGDVLGVVLRRALLPAGGLAGVGRHCRGRSLLSVRGAPAGRGRRRNRLPHRRRDLSALRRDPARRPTDRAHARDSQLDPRRRRSSDRSCCSPCCSCLAAPGSQWRLASSVSMRRRGRFAFMPAGVDFFLLGALAAYSGAGA